jgi:hypothetical protein
LGNIEPAQAEKGNILSGGDMAPEENTRNSFRFQFWKEKVWVGLLLLPLGMLVCGLPIFLFFVLELPLGARVLVELAFIPAYIGGGLIFYIVFSLVFTRVVITSQTIALHTPRLIFPFLPVTKKIPIEQIKQIQFMVPHFIWRSAIELTTRQGDKNRRVKIPQFKDSQYIQNLRTIQARIVPTPDLARSLSGNAIQGSPALINSKRLQIPPRSIFSMNVSGLWAFSSLLMVCISGWITLSLPIPSRLEAFGIGFGLAATCFWLSFCGFLPAGLGQVAFWFLGRPSIHAAMWLFQIPDVSWDTPAVVNNLLRQFNLPPIHSTLVEFTFWATLFISLEFTLGNTVDWFRRRNYDRAIQKEEQNELRTG